MIQELDHLKNQFMDVKIPLELLEYLDQGKNPQLYTKECLERTLNKNKEVSEDFYRHLDSYKSGNSVFVLLCDIIR